MGQFDSKVMILSLSEYTLIVEKRRLIMEKLYVRDGAEELTLNGLFDEFILSKKCLNVSSYTISFYERCFVSFAKFYDVGQPCSSMALSIVNKYILHLKSRDDINDITINTNLRGLRALLYYGMEHGYINQFKVKLIRAEKKIKETYTEAELAILLKKPNIKTCNFAELRNWAMINYLLGTGNRLETMANVKIGDINFAEKEIKLLKLKNRKQYIIPLSDTLSKVLKEYLLYRKETKDDYLFCSSFGEQISKGTIQTQIQLYNRSRGVLRTSIHAFRHTFAKNWILNGGDIISLQNILGHSSMEMVKEYVAMFGNDLKVGFNSHNPLDVITQKTIVANG